MEYSNLPKDLPVPEDDDGCNHLINSILPDIALPNQYGNLLKMNRFMSRINDNNETLDRVMAYNNHNRIINSPIIPLFL